ISVLDDSEELPDQPPRARPAREVVWFDYGLAFVATLIASLVAWGVAGVLALPNISLIFLAAVLLVAVRSSMGPALACAGLSFLAYDFLFIPPSFSLNIQREEDVLTLLFFLLMSALTGKLAARQRRQLQALRDTQEQTSELLDLSGKMTAATDG
ncbi:histidine kinase, partial [Pseudomonas syringae pv. syringae FF5]